MNINEVARQIDAIVSQMYEAGDIVTAKEVIDFFRATVPQTELDDIGQDAIQAHIHAEAKRAIKKKARDESEQLSLFPYGSFDAAITVPAGEGVNGVRKILFASETEMQYAYKLKTDHRAAVNNKTEAFERFMDLVVPVMRDNGFSTVLEALQHLGLA